MKARVTDTSDGGSGTESPIHTRTYGVIREEAFKIFFCIPENYLQQVAIHQVYTIVESYTKHPLNMYTKNTRCIHLTWSTHKVLFTEERSTLRSHGSSYYFKPITLKVFRQREKIGWQTVVLHFIRQVKEGHVLRSIQSGECHT